MYFMFQTNKVSDVDFQRFSLYYKSWKQQVEPEVVPHPYEQFKKHTIAEDENLLNSGKKNYSV